MTSPALRHANARHPVRLVLGVGALLLGALVVGPVLAVQPLLALAVPALAVGAIASFRFPAASVFALFVLTGSYGTVDAFTSFPVGEFVDVILASLWLGAVWHLLTHPRERPVRLLPGVVAVAVYLFITVVGILTADTLTIGLHSFRASAWYVMAFLLVAYGPWSPEQRRRINQGLLVVIAAVSGYAVLRLVIGPAGPERDLAEVSTYTNFIDVQDDDIGLVGSLTSRHELSAWLAVAIPFALALSLSLRRWWRVLAVLATATCTVALLGTEVRIALVASVAAILVILALQLSARGFGGSQLGIAATALVALVVGGALAFSVVVGESGRGVNRYAAVFSPSEDVAYQQRLDKWRVAVRDTNRHPFGHGAGTAGRVQQQYGRFVNIGTFDVDSSYLKIAYEQGWVVMGLFCVAMILLLVGLARGAALIGVRERAGPAIGATGALVALLVLFGGGVYIEGLPALTGWLIVGAGLGQVAWPDDGG